MRIEVHTMSTQSNQTSTPIACNPNAIPAEKQAEWTAAGQAIYAAVEAMTEVEDGYRFRLPNDADLLVTAATYISYEHLCCAFLHFTLEVMPNDGPLWLSLTGGPGVKEYIHSVFASEHLISDTILQS
jgi:hypothetical protein